jgi:hypothetical protein
MSISMVGEDAVSKRRWPRLLIWIAGGAFLLLAIAIGGLVVIGASLLSGTSLTRDDFPTPADAAAFVSDHVPVRLPAGAVVHDLTYERFTDWHLRATVHLGSNEAVNEYLRQSHDNHQEDVDYCGPASSTASSVSYFLPQWHACGNLARAPEQGALTVVCYTR